MEAIIHLLNLPLPDSGWAPQYSPCLQPGKLTEEVDALGMVGRGFGAKKGLFLCTTVGKGWPGIWRRHFRWQTYV